MGPMTTATTITSIALPSPAPQALASQVPFDPTPLIAEELALPRSSVAAVVALLVEGGTVPFIARYRKEATGGLDEVQPGKSENLKLELPPGHYVVICNVPTHYQLGMRADLTVN